MFFCSAYITGLTKAMATAKGQDQEEIREEFPRWSARELASGPFDTRPSRPGRVSCPRVQDGWPAS